MIQCCCLIPTSLSLSHFPTSKVFSQSWKQPTQWDKAGKDRKIQQTRGFFLLHELRFGEKSLKWLVAFSAAICFFYLSTMKALLLHVNNVLLISVAHWNVLLALIRMRGQTPNQHDLMKLNVSKFQIQTFQCCWRCTKKQKTWFAQEEEMHKKEESLNRCLWQQWKHRYDVM